MTCECAYYNRPSWPSTLYDPMVYLKAHTFIRVWTAQYLDFYNNLLSYLFVSWPSMARSSPVDFGDSGLKAHHPKQRDLPNLSSGQRGWGVLQQYPGSIQQQIYIYIIYMILHACFLWYNVGEVVLLSGKVGQNQNQKGSLLGWGNDSIGGSWKGLSCGFEGSSLGARLMADAW